MTVRLFEPLELRGMTLDNRIVVEPMTHWPSPRALTVADPKRWSLSAVSSPGNEIKG